MKCNVFDGVNLFPDPPLWSLQPSYTMPMLANGHAKTGLTSFYNGTLPRGRLEHHVATTCSRYELRQSQQPPVTETDCIKSYDHLLGGGGNHDLQRDSCEPDTETHRMIDSTSGSGVHQSEVSFIQ